MDWARSLLRMHGFQASEKQWLWLRQMYACAITVAIIQYIQFDAERFSSVDFLFNFIRTFYQKLYFVRRRHVGQLTIPGRGRATAVSYRCSQSGNYAPHILIWQCSGMITVLHIEHWPCSSIKAGWQHNSLPLIWMLFQNWKANWRQFFITHLSSCSIPEEKMEPW
jgi:hypothetical protein